MASYHHGNLPATLINAAVAIAAERDLDKLSVRELTRIAGVSPTAAYRHFPNQESILREVQTRCRARFIEALQPSTSHHAFSGAGLPEEDRVRSFVQQYTAWATEHPGWYRTAFRRGADGPEGKESAWSAIAEVIGDVLAPVAEREDEPTQLSIQAITATLHGLAMYLVDGPISGMSNRDRSALIDLTAHTICSSVHLVQGSGGAGTLPQGAVD